MNQPTDQPVSDEPSAEFFELILETDLANIIKKAQSGAPLTKREREMIDEERSRRSKISEPVSFQLEGEGAIPALDRMTQRELADVWGYSFRQLKNWLADGKKANDHAPVTQPDLMCAWFKRIYAPRDAPEKLRAAAARIIAGHHPEKKSSVYLSANGAGIPKIEIADGEKGLLAMLDRYRTAEVTLHNKYMAAVDLGDEVRAQFLLSEWSKMGEKVRGLEKTAPRALEELKIYVRRDEVQRELEPLHSAIIKSFRQELRMARVRLKATETPEAWSRCVDELVERVSKMLIESEFAEPLEFQAA